MTTVENPWLEAVAVPGGTAQVSKFLNTSFYVSAAYVRNVWSDWSAVERLTFAAAFAARPQLNDQDQQILDFIIDEGDASIWNALALLVAQHQSQPTALNFLLRRVSEGVEGNLANYYQALTKIRSPECVPILRKALLRHRQEMDSRPTLTSWDDRFVYLNYLACSAALSVITGKVEYRHNLTELLQHSDESVRKMVRMVASTQGVEGVS